LKEENDGSIYREKGLANQKSIYIERDKTELAQKEVGLSFLGGYL
jgi:hypothetical protein